MKANSSKLAAMALSIIAAVNSVVSGGSLQAPPEMFKDLNDEILGEAIIVNGKQLFIDDYIIEELKGAEKILNQPKKHPKNPLLVRDMPWEKAGPGYGTIIYDKTEGMFQMWYGMRIPNHEPSEQILGYATSKDGISWTKPIINKKDKNNIVFTSKIPGFQAAGIFKDPVARDPQKRYKMLFSACQDGTSKTWSVNAAYSPDGIYWTDESENPVVPFSDTQSCPFWDSQGGRYVAYLRYGPPNTRVTSRIESEDFVHWSPKITVLRNTKLDEPLATCFYQMAPIPYEGVYLGLIAAYHSETLKPIPKDKPWTDRKDLQLLFSPNGMTWQRVVANGAIGHSDLSKDRNWKETSMAAAFLPYGRRDKDWDWGTVSPYFTPDALVLGDEIWFYYFGIDARNWWTYAGDPPKFQPDAPEPTRGVGLATLRVDGFVSINAEKEGTMTTKPFVFIGDTLEVNADAASGAIQVEALDEKGNIIEGFSKNGCQAITSDSVRHILKWKGSEDCQLIQARPIKLRFYLKKAKLYSFTPRIRHNHYIPSYD